jgi:MFS family permease
LLLNHLDQNSNEELLSPKVPSCEPTQVRRSWAFIVLLGAVSLLADMTYEGARSLLGPFLGALGASAAVVGLVAGLGEFVGYALRFVSGTLADRSRRYWAFTLGGYALNLLAVPLLALTGRWETAAGLIVVERFGKAIRTPARDALLSHAAVQTGYGRGFGLHETLDQVGAVLGPLLVAGVFFTFQSYRLSFGILAVPALLALGTLLVAQRLFPRPWELGTSVERSSQRSESPNGRWPRAFWLYVSFVAVSVLGFANFPLIAYHFKAAGLVPEATIALLFALAMGVDALLAYPMGQLFDRWGFRTLGLVPLLTVPIAPLAFSYSAWAGMAGVIFWGAAMGAQETVLRAAIAKMIPSARRGTAYGIFHAIYGLAWLAGSTAMGLLYEQSALHVAVFAVVLQLLSVPLGLAVLKEATRRARGPE